MTDTDKSTDTFMSEDRLRGLKRLTEPFPRSEISWKPKPTKAQTDQVKSDYKKGVKCKLCGGWHHPQVVHLEYVGHAATTKRLLEVDPMWNWDFLHKDDIGMPIYDSCGGLWITLTVLGVTRMGYGDAEGKKGANAVKETIGDAIRNAAMRFGVALELWHKGDFAKDDDDGNEVVNQKINYYPDEQFQANFPLWEQAISAGKKTAPEITSFLSHKGYALTEHQAKKLKSVKTA